MIQQEHIPVFYEGQDDLIDVLATSMASVCYNTSFFIDFYILDCGICKFNKKLLETMKEKFNNFSIEFIPVDLKQFEGLKGWGEENKHIDCYSRLLISNLKPNIDKCIYLDSDTIALDDIKLLWDIDVENYFYAAALELGCTKSIQDNLVNNLKLSKEHKYHNAGVLVLNLKKWRENNIEEKVTKLAKEYNNFFLNIHEDLFAFAFGSNNYKKLDLRFNMTDRINRIKDVNVPEITNKYIENEWKNIVIQHLTPTKPWKEIISENGCIIKNLNAFWFYAKKTPFYEGLAKKYDYYTELLINKIKNINQKKEIKLFGFIPFITVVQKGIKVRYKLFNFITLFNMKQNV